MPNNKGVISNVYVESPNLLSHQRKHDPIKKINPKSLCSKARLSQTPGYDRRAQLLAYAQELRHANTQQCYRNSRPKHKKYWRWPPPMQKIKLLFSRFEGINNKWKYEPIITEDYSDGTGLKEEGNGRRKSHFCTRLKCFLKKMLHCKNGGC